MPQLTTHLFYGAGESGDKFEYAASVEINQEGVFSVGLPNTLSDIASLKVRDFPDVLINRSQGISWVQSTTLQDAVDFIDACVAQYVDVTRTTERVIIYGQCHNLESIKVSDGKAYKSSDSIAGGVSFFSIGLAAAVMDKTLLKRGLTTDVLWEKVKPDSLDNFKNRLNSFTLLDIDPEFEGMREIPYTEEAAQFFYNLMFSLCEIGYGIDSFLSNSKSVENAIATGAPGAKGFTLTPKA